MRNKKTAYSLLVAINLLIYAFIGLAYYNGLRIGKKYTPLIDASMVIKLNLTEVHLYLEELASGDKYNSLFDINDRIDEAIWYARVIKDGGENWKNSYYPVDVPSLEKDVDEIIAAIDSLQPIVYTRLVNIRKEYQDKTQEKSVDAAFNNAMELADSLEVELHALLKADLEKFRMLNRILLIASILLSIVLIIILALHEKQGVESIRAMRISNGKLETELIERMSVEMALRESELKYRGIFDSASDAMLIIDSNYLIVDLNPAATALFGYRDDELRDRNFNMIIKIDVYGYGENGLHNGSGNMGMFGRCKGITKKGVTIDIEIRYSKLELGLGQQFLFIIRDITELKKLQELKSRAQRLETAGKIAGQVAHDFNNLLGPLIAYPGIIKDELPENHLAIQYIEYMEEAAKQIADINQQLLALGRRGHFNLEKLEINNLISHTLRQLNLSDDAISVRTELSTAPLYIRGGRAQIVRVLLNLLNNSIDSINGTGEILVSSERIETRGINSYSGKIPDGEFVKITIKDTGCGIPEDITPSIFDAFYTTKVADKKRGSGLGLSVVDSIVRDHDGFIDLVSNPDEGTSFMIYFPYCEEETGKVPVSTLAGGSETVLVIDDDSVQREVGNTLLKKLGYKAESVASGEEAIELLKRRNFDLLILDMQMPPGMDGADTYKTAIEFNPDQKAIIMSGFAESDRVKTAIAMGVSGYVRKPVDLERMAIAVRKALDKHIHEIVA